MVFVSLALLAAVLRWFLEMSPPKMDSSTRITLLEAGHYSCWYMAELVDLCAVQLPDMSTTMSRLLYVLSLQTAKPHVQSQKYELVPLRSTRILDDSI